MTMFNWGPTQPGGPPPFNRERWDGVLKNLEVNFGIDDDGDRFGDWEFMRLWFLVEGANDDLMAIRSMWDVRPPVEAYDFIVAIATGELAGVPRSPTEFGQRPSRPSPRSSPWQAVSYSHRNGGSVASVRLNVAANSGPSNSAVSASVMVIVPDTALSRPTPGMSPSAMFGLAFHHTPSIRVVLTPQWTQSE